MSTSVASCKQTGAGTMKVTGNAFVPAFIPQNLAAPMDAPMSTVAASSTPQAQPMQQMPLAAPTMPVESPRGQGEQEATNVEMKDEETVQDG